MLANRINKRAAATSVLAAVVAGLSLIRATRLATRPESLEPVAWEQLSGAAWSRAALG
jgi:hypothetical protein